MITKSDEQNTGEPDEKRQRVKIGKLNLNKETVKDLTSSDAKRIRGGGCIGTAKVIAGGNEKGAAIT